MVEGRTFIVSYCGENSHKSVPGGSDARDADDEGDATGAYAGAGSATTGGRGADEEARHCKKTRKS